MANLFELTVPTRIYLTITSQPLFPITMVVLTLSYWDDVALSLFWRDNHLDAHLGSLRNVPLEREAEAYCQLPAFLTANREYHKYHFTVMIYRIALILSQK